MTALILAAHGSSGGDRISAILRQRVAELEAEGRFDQVKATFAKEPPLFGDVLQDVRADEVFVVPFFTSSGWYSKQVLPREMGLTFPVTRRGTQTIRLTEPVGEHPLITERIGRLACRAVEANRLDPAETALVLVGHGTTQHKNSGVSARRHAGALRRSSAFAEVLAVFLDEPPQVEEVFELTARSSLVIVPHLIGGSIHLTRDVPQRLGVPLVDGVYPPPPARVRDRRIVITDSPFDGPSIVEVVLDLVQSLSSRPTQPAVGGTVLSQVVRTTPS